MDKLVEVGELEAHPELSISLALGDHNFTQNDFLSIVKPSRSRVSLADILNPHSSGEQPINQERTYEASSPDTDYLANADSDYMSIFTTSEVSLGAMNIDTDNASTTASDWASNFMPSPANSDSELFSATSAWWEIDIDGQSDSEPEGMEDSAEGRGLSSDAPARVPTSAKSSKKRHRQSDSMSGHESDNYMKKKTKRVKDGEGESKSAMASRARREKLKEGKLTIEEERLEEWKEELREDDPDVEFYKDDIRRVRHSKCGKAFLVKDPFDTVRWRKHLKDCVEKGWNRRAPAAGMRSLLSMGWVKPGKTNTSVPETKENKPPAPEKTVPCPGLTALDHDRIPKYLLRTGFLGGGARSITVIAHELFKKAFSRLKQKNKEKVLDTQLHEHAWRNDHDRIRVFSTKCKHIVADLAPNRPLPCTECRGILRSRTFKALLRKPVPADENFIFTNKRFRSKRLGEIYARTIGLKDIIEAPVSLPLLHAPAFFKSYLWLHLKDAKTTPCIRYAQGALNGKYNDEVFSGLIQAMVEKFDRQKRGVGMQNFYYAPAWDELCHTIKIHSPRAFKALREHLPMRTEGSFR